MKMFTRMSVAVVITLVAAVVFLNSTTGFNQRRQLAAMAWPGRAGHLGGDRATRRMERHQKH